MEVHRFLGVSAAVLVLVHLACVLANDPRSINLLKVLSAPPRAQAATAALAALVLLVGVVALKARLRLSYESWRWMHVGLAAAVLVFSGLHTVWLNHALKVPAMSAAFLVLVAIVVTVASYRWLWRGILDPSTEFVIREVRSESPTISTVVLAPRGDEGSWRFVPGQFAWLRMAQSPTAEEHPFTISSSARDEYTSFTVRHAGDFTRTLTALPPGTPVWVDGPHGAFSGDIGRCSGFVLIAGGVGITPMMSMLRTAADRGDRRPYRLVVVASRPEDLLFREELGFLRSSLDLVVTEVMRRPTDDWEGHYGDLGLGLLSLVLGSTEQPESVDFFLCGPPAMIHDSLEVIDALDVDPGRVHTELFDFV
jgi:3-phenylpropionate/trans-cinnamate dioxygenase ferredoxin reductase subunit